MLLGTLPIASSVATNFKPTNPISSNWWICYNAHPVRLPWVARPAKRSQGCPRSDEYIGKAE